MFGSKLERLAKLLHDARMRECWGNFNSGFRFIWPETREEWEHYQHNPHPSIDQAMAQAKAVLKEFKL